MSAMSRLSVSALKVGLDLKKFFRFLILVNTVAAAGSASTDATALTAGRNVVTGADGAKGVRLPKTELDMAIVVVNTVADQDLLVYPASLQQINALTATTGAFTVVGGAQSTFLCDALGHWYVSASNLTGTATTSSQAELDQLDGATINVLATEAAAGITGGVGTVYASSVVRPAAGIFKTAILLDLTGLGSSTTDLDIIGQGASAAHIGQITAARNGTVLSGRITCLEAPVGGVTDIDVYAATVATGKFDDLVTDLTETALHTHGGAWSIGQVGVFTGIPAANGYLYLTGGAGGTAASYSAGKFLIELEGY